MLAFSNSSKNSSDNLLTKYLTMLSDYLNAPKVYRKFLQVEGPSAKILAYQVALEAIMTKTTCNIFKKLSYLCKSEESFKKAVALAPNDIEIRFMRLAVQFEIPEYLGCSIDITSDKKFAVKNMKNFNCQNIPLSLRKQILGFMYRSKMFTAVEIEEIQTYLSHKIKPLKNYSFYQF